MPNYTPRMENGKSYESEFDCEYIMYLRDEMGLKPREIAKELGTTGRMISNILAHTRRKMRVEQERGRELDTGKCMALYKAGWSIRAIADDCRVDSEQVVTYLRSVLDKA